MRIAITGGAGFLGYHLCNKLSGGYNEILVLDIVSIEPQEYPKNVTYINSDVRDKEQLKQIFKNIDLIVHAAAALPLWKKDDIFSINVDGTKNVLEAAEYNNIKRVVFISSTAVYGIPKKHPIYEEDPLVGVGHYGKSKIEAEKICLDYRKSGMCIPIVRPKTFIGTARLGVFQILYDWIECGKKIPIIGDGRNHYQLLDVEDLVNAIYLLLNAPADKANDTFNIGAEKFDTVKADVGSLCDYARTGAGVLSTPAWLIVPLLSFFEKLKLSPLYKWVYATAGTDSFVSINRIKSRLGWSPIYSNSQALIRSYKWYLDHKDEFKNKTGITHRVAWKQGILGIVKKLL